MVKTNHNHSGYAQGCRCDICRAAASEYQKEYRQRTKERRNQKQAARYHARRTAALAQLGGKCVKCGADDDLHIDHIDPASKTAHIRDLFHGGSQERLEAELALCQLLCRSCHGAKTRGEQLAYA